MGRVEPRLAHTAGAAECDGTPAGTQFHHYREEREPWRPM